MWVVAKAKYADKLSDSEHVNKNNEGGKTETLMWFVHKTDLRK